MSRVREILSWYGSDNPGALARPAAYAEPRPAIAPWSEMHTLPGSTRARGYRCIPT